MKSSRLTSEPGVQPISFGWAEILDAWKRDARTQQFCQDHIARIPRALDRLISYSSVSRIDELDRSTMRRYLGELADNGIKGKPLTSKSINNYLTMFRAFFDWCKVSEYTPAGWDNPCMGIKGPRNQIKQARALTIDEIVRIYESARDDERSDTPRSKRACGSPVMRSGLYWLMACTGIRVSTAEHLRVRHLDLHGDQPVIHIPAFNSGKNSRERDIVVSNYDRELLLDALEHNILKPDADDYAFERPHKRIFLLDAEHGGVEVCDHTGRTIGFHSIRRFHSTHLLRCGTDPKLVQQRLGHKSLMTTMTHYNDVQMDDQISVASVFEQTILQKINTSPLTKQGDSGHDVIAHQSTPASHPISDVERDRVDSDTIDEHQPSGSSALDSLPRSRSGKGMAGKGKWRTGDLNPLPPNPFSDPDFRQEALYLLRDQMAILDQLLDRR